MDSDFLCYIATGCGSVLPFPMPRYVRSSRGEDGHFLSISQVVKYSQMAKMYKPPPRFLNSGSNARNSFLILANGWLNLNLHSSKPMSFFHVFIDILMVKWRSHNRMANLMLPGPRSLPTILFKSKNWGTLWTDLALVIRLVASEWAQTTLLQCN